jgi:hypothetical protein
LTLRWNFWYKYSLLRSVDFDISKGEIRKVFEQTNKNLLCTVQTDREVDKFNRTIKQI